MTVIQLVATVWDIRRMGLKRWWQVMVRFRFILLNLIPPLPSEILSFEGFVQTFADLSAPTRSHTASLQFGRDRTALRQHDLDDLRDFNDNAFPLLLPRAAFRRSLHLDDLQDHRTVSVCECPLFFFNQ